MTGLTSAASAASALPELIRAAAAQVAEAWEEVRQDSPAREEVERVLQGLTAAIAAAGVAPLSATPSLATSQLTRRLLGLLRIRFLELADRNGTRVDLAELLACLRNFETVGSVLEPRWDQRFADRLTGPDGLELVVELARSGPVTPLQERQLGLVYSAAFGLSSVASDVIELARGGDRLVDLEPLPFSVVDIMESVRDIVQPIAEEKGLEIQLSTCERNARVGHPVALSRILLNLTTNALKFTDEGSVGMSARESSPTTVEFSVRDTGRGIPPQAMALLFEPFRRRQKDRDYAFSGSGLGLSICRKLVEAMNGELKVETEQGAGTRFHFTLDLPIADLGGQP